MDEVLTHDVDVCVIGAGGAGLMAAAVAAEAGARVAILAKSPLGLGNCTAYAGGGFSMGTEPVLGPGAGQTVNEHLTATKRAGRGLNDGDLVEMMCANAARTVKGMERFGVAARWHHGGCSVRAWGRLSGRMGGTGLTLPLVGHVRGCADVVREDFFASSLLLSDDGAVAGVRGLTLASGGPVEVRAPAVIVATGGAGRIYGRTDNPIRTTGDGYRLLFEAGIAMQDMEFVQFYPLALDGPGAVPYLVPLDAIDLAPLRNSEGRDFLREDVLGPMGLAGGREANIHARDRCTVAIAREWRAGREVILHLEEAAPGRRLDDLMRWIAPFLPAGVPAGPGPIRVRPTQHYFCGGAVVDVDGWTGVPGLFAAGEVTGGVDGANRVGGNALSNICVFGERAGLAAASFALETQARRAAGPGGATRVAAGDWAELRRVARWRANADSGERPAAFRARLNAVCDAHLGPVRNTAGLRLALTEVTAMADALDGMVVSSWMELLGALEAQSLVLTAEMVVRSALEREESRGAHFREDFPGELQSWERHVTLLAPAAPGSPMRVRFDPIRPGGVAHG
jgi:succinate dehydrogenase/fumarate reductase flavoprotein subunit